MIPCTEKNTSSTAFSGKSATLKRPILVARSARLLLPLFLLLLASCQSLPLTNTESNHLTGKWTIHYLRSAESILKSRGGPLDADRIRSAEIHLKQKFYGEFEFTDKGEWALLYKVEGKEKKGRGTYEVTERQGQRLVLSVLEGRASDGRNAEAANAGEGRETLIIEFLDTDLILLSKQGDSELPPLVFQRETGAKP